ncbi:outer membrane beta-barrel protein [Ancylobacter sp. 6x-1]|uniref:Outer membrane beta-barrel protein n=1 Tax=Ancylobacter crimeensis TaxID=2579147 RepID=A0ABT0D9S1_9HYPH|nr:outer membrane beta-barrel protein [Ancylobacter crimeensis]MCK0196698.1 outer membrane beta-barrel protein [Ancylobacter crimeensis]
MHRALPGTAAALAIALLTAPASAADLAYPAPQPVLPPPAPAYSWTGLYVGGYVGYGQAKVKNVDTPLASGYLTYGEMWDSGGMKGTAWFGGVQAGYNYQFANNVVLGGEADLVIGSFRKTYGFGYTAYAPGIANAYAGEIRAKVDAFGTIRARLGYAFDRLMPYVTGGAAWANAKVSASGSINGIPVYSDSVSDTYWGWSAGAGVEYALSSNWSVRAEYIYADFGSPDLGRAYRSQDHDFSIQAARLGVNYKF